jgi:hypothetical protein
LREPSEVPTTRIGGFVIEYASHEANYGLANILAGARCGEDVDQAVTFRPFVAYFTSS